MKECLTEEILQQYFDGELEQVRLENAGLHLAGCQQCASRLSELESESNLVATALAPEFEVAVPTQHLRRRIDAAIAGLNVVTPVQTDATPAWRSWLGAVSAMVSLSPQRSFAYGGLAAVILFATIFGIVNWRQAPTQVTPDHQVAYAPSSPAVTPTVSENLPRVSQAPVNNQASVNSIQRTSNSTSGRKNRPTAPQSQPNAQTEAEVKLLPGERSYLKSIAALDSTIKSEKATMRPALQAEYERNLALVDRAIAATRSAAKRNPNDPDAADFMFAAYQSKVDLLNTIADARVYNRPR